MRLLVTPSETPLRGEIRVAADKSISHRAVIFGAIADGTSRVHNLLEGEDVLATIHAFRQMGVVISKVCQNSGEGKSVDGGAGEYVIHGVGLHGLQPPTAPLDMGNSGTALRLMTGLLCAQPWHVSVSGDESLRARPMGRIIQPLTRMGAIIKSVHERPPLAIAPTPQLRGIHYCMPVASAQVKSCLLLAGLYASGRTSVTEPSPTRDHTERMLAEFGCAVTVMKNREIRLNGDMNSDMTNHMTNNMTAERKLRACEITVPADLSSAAFFIVAASIVRGSDVLLRGVGINPSRNGVLAILKRMGADIQLHESPTTAGGEPIADIRVRASELRGCRIDGNDIALAIDEIPAIAIAAACARGVTIIRDAGELRVKESDRIRAMADGLKALGVGVEEHTDGLTIIGGSLGGGRVESHGDHRIAMAFAIAGGVAKEAVEVADCDNIATSFPEFCQIANHAGLNIQAT